MSRYDGHAGHNADGKSACGAIGFMRESTECRKINKEVIRLLKVAGHTVFDSTVDNAKNVSQNLTQIINKINSRRNIDLAWAIHMNAFMKVKKDKKVKGVEIWLYNASSEVIEEAERVLKKLVALGFTNRGIKYSKTLAVLRRTKHPTMLIEVCFCDDEDDYNLYKKLGYKKIAKAIAEGIHGRKIIESKDENGIKAGKKLVLKNVPCYITATAELYANKKTGEYYLWSDEVINGRVKITNSKANVGMKGKVTGYIDKKYI